MKRTVKERTEDLGRLLEANPRGLTNREIRRHYHYKISLSTIQKYLNALESEGRVRRSNNYRSPRYQYITEEYRTKR